MRMKVIPFFFIELLFHTHYLALVVFGNVVIPVQHKYKGREKTPNHMIAHNIGRRGRFLSHVNVPMGGSGVPSSSGLYIAKIRLGTPPKDYFLQIDTGSDLSWVPCDECSKCPKKSNFINKYNPKDSSTSSVVKCTDSLCNSSRYPTYIVNGCQGESPCKFNITYEDGDYAVGYLMRDIVTLDQVKKNHQTTSINGTIMFGCADDITLHTANPSHDAYGGVIGFGRGGLTLLSQLTGAGKLKRKFSHCFDSKNGGGIFAVGEVVHPKMKTTPLMDVDDFSITLTRIEVNGSNIPLPDKINNHPYRGRTVIDCGSTLPYFPASIHEPLMEKVMSQHSVPKKEGIDDLVCIDFTKNVDEYLPTVTFLFANSVPLRVYPHQYMFKFKGQWCCSWMKLHLDPNPREEDVVILLGDAALFDKVVHYDLEHRVIGFSDQYDCSSGIKLRDDETRKEYDVEAHNILSSTKV